MTRRRRRFTAEFKKKVALEALEALRGAEPVQTIAARHEVHPNQMSTWKRQAVEGIGAAFAGGAKGVSADVGESGVGAPHGGFVPIGLIAA